MTMHELRQGALVEVVQEATELSSRKQPSKEALVGAKTVKGPWPERVSRSRAALTAATGVV